MLYVLLAIGTATVLFAPGWLDRYLRGLPDAPRCPGCSALTRASGPPGLIAALLPMLAATVVRECGACGWRGRMRLRLAADPQRS